MSIHVNQLIEQLLISLDQTQITHSETELLNHSKDESYHAGKNPTVIVYPRSKEDVVHIMAVSSKMNIPVIPYGRGSSLEGHIIPIGDAITIDFAEMNKIIDIRAEDLLVTVQPGIGRIDLNNELRKHGLFFSVDPGADASIGGMVATNASGTTSVKYGTMRDQVRDLEVVLANGSVIHTGNLAAKSSSGYHLNGLFVGSEGTLGTFTEITLRVFGIPEFQVAARVNFETVDSAIDAVTTIRQAGIPIARVELVDAGSIEHLNAYSKTNFPMKTTLFLEFHGNEAGLAQDLEFTKEIMEDHGCSNFVVESDTKARNIIWEARHNLAYAFIHSYRDKKMMTTDVCVPISSLATAIHFARDNMDKKNIVGGIIGHVGDGNFHVSMMVNMDHTQDVKNAVEFNADLVEFGLSLGGTCTGEHGVGIGKLKYQKLEHGPAYEVMQVIKKSLDPQNLLNPGKLILVDS
ncbi:FAD-binding oxidoreductase [Kurthia sibirica]|uniref:D-lactate dehydrogenase (cytochrome) n=1 Tax=Kurthia sibirica TaxID=202750 RepID=A0A2U3ANH5_9BACL|nr:FAD-linked oxidase C-terminal domain-containing protein [Kurthia sibirica]PWI26049.1 2-hydroxy-acid oxidase [Kurthia sibirica]GEK34800.1 2-hydroxy-acid oxidase [Kurthia sibirica]